MKNKYFYKFLNLNKKILLQENKNNIIIFDRQRFVPSILSCFFSIALAQKYNSNISVYTTNKNSDYIKIFKSFGINKFYYKYFDDWKIIIKSFFIFFPTIFNINKNGIDWFIKKFKINNIFFGDLIYDTYIRFDKSYLNPKLDFKFIKILFLSIIKIEKIYKVFVKSKPKVIISNGGGYATLGGISARIGDNLKIKIITPYIDKKKEFHLLIQKIKNAW